MAAHLETWNDGGKSEDGGFWQARSQDSRGDPGPDHRHAASQDDGQLVVDGERAPNKKRPAPKGFQAPKPEAMTVETSSAQRQVSSYSKELIDLSEFVPGQDSHCRFGAGNHATANQARNLSRVNELRH